MNAAARAIAIVAALAAPSNAASNETAAPRYVELPRGAAPAEAAWIARDDGRVAYGDGLDVVLWGAGRELRRWRTATPSVDGLFFAGRLVISTAAPALLAVALDGPDGPDRPGVEPRPLPGAPALRGRTRLARLPDRLVLVEAGVGLHLIGPLGHAGHAGHAGHGPPPRRTTIPFDVRPDTAVTASGGQLLLGAADGGLVEIDGERPGISHRLSLPRDAGRVRALAATAERLFVLTDDGLLVTRHRDRREPLRWSRHPHVRGVDLALAGRELLVVESSGVSRGGRLVRYRDRRAGSELYVVSVNSNFFSQASLQIDVGDRVQWRQTSGFHNVASCEPTQSGCDGRTAAESFGNGPPAGGLWIYTHTFTTAGSNPYVCQSHAPFMTGEVTVAAPPVGPPPIPAGDDGSTPMTVDKLDAGGDTLRVDWDALSCPAVETRLLYGGGTALRDGQGPVPSGAVCDAGASAPYTWFGSPPTELDAGGLLWWLLVATDGAGVEGSWGRDGSGAERVGPGPGGGSGLCGAGSRDASATCP